MVKYMIMEILNTNKIPKGLGLHIFNVQPAIGELVTLMDMDDCERDIVYYQIVQIIHGAYPDNQNKGGNEGDLLVKRFYEASSASLGELVHLL
ncbi:MAG: hypothetical protein F6K09_01710 [Merismopedia sp. SIO2A8]|nr:hypothetical protein [Symploca sp. SIO2B6]NET47444.1 hypothetical protein [Merismopedia sp. SIO2A8]